MGKTSIEWTDMSINPIRARDKETGAVGHYCQKISSGCAHCYASRLQRRFKMPEFGGVKDSLPENIEVFLDESKLEEVIRRKKPTKFFWVDMTDLFGWWVPDEWIDRCLAVMALTPQHTHQVLTKRPERAAEYFCEKHISDIFTKILQESNAKRYLDKNCPIAQKIIVEIDFFDRLKTEYPQIERRGDPPWPLENVWIGTSVENQEQANKRIPELLKIPAAVRFLSCEPLLGPVDLQLDSGRESGGPQGWEPGDRPDWAIVGGESGPGDRPMHPDWVRSIRDQCQAAGVPFFFKQWGEWKPLRDDADYSDPRAFAEMPADGEGSFGNGRNHALIYNGVRRLFNRVGKKAAGRMLDGREWSEFPVHRS